MEYKMEELVPIVGQLAGEYTGHASTSVTYETAEQLMEAVLYCIREARSVASAQDKSPTGELSGGQLLPARQVYDAGRTLVEEKTRTALQFYNRILSSFVSYDNACLYDTVVKGIPEFFKWYDVRFCPQDTILTLDYPVLKDLSGYQGIDRIYEFLRCVEWEQEFLGCFSEREIVDLLSRYSRYYRSMIENLAEIVLTVLAQQILAGRMILRVEEELEPEEYERMKQSLKESETGDLVRLLAEGLDRFLQTCGIEDLNLKSYLELALPGIVMRLQASVNFSEVL
ncbi:MAG: DUF6179 domain-containing protein [Lachnospiraceae bacterium]